MGPHSSSPRGGPVVREAWGPQSSSDQRSPRARTPWGSACPLTGQPRCPPHPTLLPLHTHLVTCAHPPPLSSLHREKCGNGSRVAPTGCCCGGMRSPGKDAVPDASQPQLGRGGGGAEPQTEATVAGETKAGGGAPGACPPPELHPGLEASHPLRCVRARARAYTSLQGTAALAG